MRRADRQITDKEEIIDILRTADVCRLAFNDPENGVPYILPVNFGFEETEDGVLCFYFHGATEGRKYEIIAADNRASFELDCDHELYSDATRGYCTMRYRSVIGRGTVDYITDDDEKLRALTILTDKYHPTHFEFNPAAASRTTVMRLKVESYTAKQKK